MQVSSASMRFVTRLLERGARQRARLSWPLACAVGMLLAGTPSAPARAAGDTSAALPRSFVIPGFWDPRRRPERPDLSRIQSIRFLTDFDYPPFDFSGPDGNPAGFNVDLARLICAEIKVQCTIQMRRFDTLIDALNKNEGDAIIASISPTPEMRQKLD